MAEIDWLIWAPVIVLGFVYVIWVFKHFDEGGR